MATYARGRYVYDNGGIIIHARNIQSQAVKLLVNSLLFVGIEVRAVEVPDFDPNTIQLVVGGKQL